jgi:hypothetical protein
MITSRIDNIGSVPPAKESPDDLLKAKEFGKELRSFSATFENLSPANLDAQTSNVAEHIMAAHNLAVKVRG